MDEPENKFLKILKPFSGFVDTVTKLCGVFIKNGAAATKDVGSLCILLLTLALVVQAVRQDVNFWAILFSVVLFAGIFVIMVRVFAPVDRTARSQP